jgi:hypothetical protein
MPWNPRLGRRRRGAPASVNVAASGGVWDITSGEGEFSDLAMQCSPAASGGNISVSLDTDTLDGIAATIVNGTSERSEPGPATVTSTGQVSYTKTAVGSYALSGTVKFTAVSGSVTTYNLLSQSV